MATKKSAWVLFGILVISAWVFGYAIQAGAETMKCKHFGTAIKDERIPVSDEEGHQLGLQIMEGLGICEDKEVIKVRYHAIFDNVPGKGTQAIGYTFYTFEDGSTIVLRFQRSVVWAQSGIGSATTTIDLIKGTGRFEGIKGTASSTGKNFPQTQTEPARAFSDAILTYTLPTK